MCLKVKPGAFSPSYGNNTHQISSRLLIITKPVYSNIYITHCFYLMKTPASAAGRNVRYSEENLGFICHYFFLLSSSPWQRWQVLVLFMTPNINDLLLYLCLIFFYWIAIFVCHMPIYMYFWNALLLVIRKKPNLIKCLRCWTNKLTVFGFIYCFILILYLTVFQQITAVSNNLWIVV